MTYVEWLKTWQIDSLQEVAPTKAWEAGALAMLQALIDRGHIAYAEDELARMNTKDIWAIDDSELEFHLS